MQKVEDDLRGAASLLVGPLGLCSYPDQHPDDLLVTLSGGQVKRPVALRVHAVRVRAVLQQHLHGVVEACGRGVVQHGAAAGRVGHVRVRARLEEIADQARVPRLNNLESGRYIGRWSVKLVIRFITTFQKVTRVHN